LECIAKPNKLLDITNPKVKNIIKMISESIEEIFALHETSPGFFYSVTMKAHVTSSIVDHVIQGDLTIQGNLNESMFLGHGQSCLAQNKLFSYFFYVNNGVIMSGIKDLRDPRWLICPFYHTRMQQETVHYDLECKH
jgi:hypothetical protein